MRIYFYYSFLSMDKESVSFLIFHNRSHRVEFRFRKFLYQLVIKVVTDFAGLVENHGCSSPGVDAGTSGGMEYPDCHIGQN